MKIIFLVIYYLIGIYLPDIAFPFGRTFNAIRCFVLKRFLTRFGYGNEFDSQIYLGKGDDVEIGDNCQINTHCRLVNVKIGNYVMIAPDVVFIPKLHRSESLTTPMSKQGVIDFPHTIVEDDVWIGYGVVIMPGLRIGKGSIIGAQAVVTRDVAPFTVVAGVPAKIIRSRR